MEDTGLIIVLGLFGAYCFILWFHCGGKDWLVDNYTIQWRQCNKIFHHKGPLISNYASDRIYRCRRCGKFRSNSGQRGYSKTQPYHILGIEQARSQWLKCL